MERNDGGRRAPRNIVIVLGTRPEAIKLAPVVLPARAMAQDLVDQPAIERLNKEVKRRTDVVGSFPNTTSGKTPTAATSPKDRWALLYPTEPTNLITTVNTVEQAPELATA